MVGSWYLTHATKNASWIFMLPFFCFCFVEENTRIMYEQTCRTKSMLNAYAWWCNDSCKMQCWNMITNKCRNDMFIMMLKRCLCGAWYECIYGHESPENYLSLLRIWGAQSPMCAVKKTIWIFRLPMTKHETHIQCMCDGMMQMRMHETERKQHKGVIHTYETAEIQL